MPAALKLVFEDRALREWRKLDEGIRSQFKKKLTKLATGAEVPSPRNKLRGFNGNYYKIKARASGHRLVYKYRGERLVILVIAVGERDRNAVYIHAQRRSTEL